MLEVLRIEWGVKSARTSSELWMPWQRFASRFYWSGYLHFRVHILRIVRWKYF